MNLTNPELSTKTALLRLKHRRLALVMIFIISFAALILIHQKYYRSHINKIQSEISQRRYRDAIGLISSLERMPFTKTTELNYYKGECHLMTGRTDIAIEIWNSIRHNPPLYQKSILKLGEMLENLGRLADAEYQYRQAMDGENREAIDIRHALIQILWLEGRLAEASELIETNWYSNFHELGSLDGSTIANLRAHLSLDFEVYPIDHVRKRLQALANKQPDDIGVRLAMVNLLLRNGEFDQASNLFSTITAAGFPELQQAINRTGLALDLQQKTSIQLTEGGYKNLQMDFPTALSVISRTQGRHTDSTKLQKHLTDCLILHPSSIEIIETLSESLIASGNREKAAELRKSRQTLDQTRRDYANLVGSDLRRDPAKMAAMAARLGRWFEAFALSSMITNQNSNATPELKPAREYQELAQKSSVKVTLPVILAESGINPDSKSISIDTAKPEINPATPIFEDITAGSGISFSFESGRTDKRQLPETMSGGLAVIDYDRDGLMDLFLLQGGRFPHNPDLIGNGLGDRLFRNLGTGKFSDVTVQAGLPDNSIGYSHGVTVGDVNNDSHDDLFITRFGHYQLLVNTGKGTFEDQTASWGLTGNRDWPTSAAFTDFDNDGDLDLYVCHYVDWDPANPRLCGSESGGPIQYCVPHLLTARPDHLFRNDGNRFTDVSDASGIMAADTDGRGLGVVTADFNRDGLMDIFVANDGTANFLFINRGNFQFTNEAFTSGVAANSDGGFQAGMGVSCGDFNGDLLPDIVVTNFYGESTSYFENLGEGLFRERSATTGLKEATRYRLGFGTALADFNNDGLLDLLTANGHVNDVRPVIPYQMPPQIFLGSAGRTFIDSSSRGGDVFQTNLLGRGLALADFNNDGMVDAAQINLGNSILIMKNKGLVDQSKNNFITLKLTGKQSNRNAIGAEIICKSGSTKQSLIRYGGGSYQSSSDLRLHIGLAKENSVDEIKIRWPGGNTQTYQNLEANAGYELTEDSAQVKPLPGFKE